MCGVTAGVLTLGVLPDAVMVPLSLIVCCCNVIEAPQGGWAVNTVQMLRSCHLLTAAPTRSSLHYNPSLARWQLVRHPAHATWAALTL